MRSALTLALNPGYRAVSVSAQSEHRAVSAEVGLLKGTEAKTVDEPL